MVARPIPGPVVGPAPRQAQRGLSVHPIHKNLAKASVHVFEVLTIQKATGHQHLDEGSPLPAELVRIPLLHRHFIPEIVQHRSVRLAHRLFVALGAQHILIGRFRQVVIPLAGVVVVIEVPRHHDFGGRIFL